MLSLFTDDQFNQMERDVVRVLSEVGYDIAHERLKAVALAGGCRESTAGRVLFGAAQVADLKHRLLAQWPPAAGAGIAASLRPVQEPRTAIGNLTPKMYDYPSRSAVGGSAANLTEIVKFAQAEPRIVGVTIPLSRQDVAPAIEQIDSTLLMARLTNKAIGCVDATVPESVPYLAAMGEALGHDPAEFVGSCNCIIPPLRLERRTAETMLRRARYHSRTMMTSMVCIGASGPVDVAGSVVLGSAEIVGGLIVAMLMDPDAPLMGYTAATQMDMRSGRVTSSSPATVQVDAGIYQLMEARFGGGTRVGGRGYISATHPGLQAAFERFTKAIGYAAYVDRFAISYSGTGNLDNGSVLSPEQLLLDLEVTEGLERLWAEPTWEAGEGPTAADRIREAVLEEGGQFLSAPHTLQHFRAALWDPAYFQRLAQTKSEEAIVAECHADYRRRVAEYQPASYPPEALAELAAILQRATADLIG